jgi:hypothetical protein
LLRPRSGPRGALAVCGAVAAWDDGMPTDASETLSEALARADRLMHGASRVLLISDGQSCDEASRRRLLELSRHCGVGVLAVADALEMMPPPPGRYPLEHAGERCEVELRGERQRHEFQQALGAGQQRLVGIAQSLGLRCRSIDTTVDPLDAVVTLLGARSPR